MPDLDVLGAAVVVTVGALPLLRRVIVTLPRPAPITGSGVNRLICEVVQSRRRPLLGPSPG